MAGKRTSRPPITSHESASPSPQCDHGRNDFHQFKDCVEKRALKSLHIQVLLGKSSIFPRPSCLGIQGQCPHDSGCLGEECKSNRTLEPSSLISKERLSSQAMHDGVQSLQAVSGGPVCEAIIVNLRLQW